MQTRLSPGRTEYPTLSTDQLRAAFLLDALFAPDKVELVYTDADRAIVGSAVPGRSPLALTADAELRAACFCERRELGVLNIGGSGAVEVDGRRFELAKFDCLYVGRGSQSIKFTSSDAAQPAAYYLLSYPAHTAYPTTLARLADATKVEMGSMAD